MEVPEHLMQAIREAKSNEYRPIVESHLSPRLRDYLIPRKLDYANFIRLSKQQAPKYSLCYHKSHMSAMRFAVSMGDDMCNYAYAYGEDLDLTFFACGGNFSSQDGEYRAHFNTLEVFEGHVLKNFSELFNIAEEIVLERLTSQNIQLHVTAYPRHPVSIEDVRALNKIAEDRRLAVKLFALCVMTDLPDIFLGLAPNHINPTYKKIILGGPLVNPDTNEDIDEPAGKTYYDLLMVQAGESASYTNVKFFFYGHLSNVRVGQKLAPLTAGELFHMDDINYSAWREIYVSTICMNHVLNARCGSFPCIVNWFLINTRDVDLYDNPMMRKKFADSDVCQEIIRQVMEIQERTFGTGPGFRSNDFRVSARLLNDAIINAKTNIILSDYSISAVTEYVGLTLRDWYHHINCEITVPALKYAYQEEMGVVLTDPEFFRDRLFELLYGLRTLNESWIVHTDLHTNNMTLMKALRPKPVPKEKTYTLYQAEDTLYKITFAPMILMIIDYSRVIIGDREKLVADFGEATTKKLMTSQKAKIVYMIGAVFPEFASKHMVIIDRLIEDDIRLTFKVISTLDVVLATNNMAIMLDLNKSYVEKHPKCAPIARKVSEEARKISLENLVAWVRGELPHWEKMEWPITRLMKVLYIDREVSWNPKEFKDPIERHRRCLPENPNLISDIFNYSNPSVLDIENFDKWGPLNTKLGSRMIQEKIPGYVDTHTACIFKQAEHPGPDLELARLAASYKIKDPFAPVTLMGFSDIAAGGQAPPISPRLEENLGMI